MLNFAGKLSAAIAIASSTIAAQSSPPLERENTRPCTAQEAVAFCSMAAGTAYQENDLWWCPESATCAWDDQNNRLDGSITYWSQDFPCEGVMICQ